ncbi:homocysteine S-methyltransferase family protein [candidate division KSB1 bacterium]|nr:homocysteine S-methyltransferase family protein [candidate division KSB1 bacterium]
MKKDILNLIKERVVLIDGAKGTMLQQKGLPLGVIPEVWNLDRPHEVKALHRSYFDAGCDVGQTNTFGANLHYLQKHHLEDRLDMINRKAVQLVLSVCPPDKFVAGNLGPTGKFWDPDEKFNAEEIEGIFFEQAGILVDEGVDLITIETLSDLREAVAAVRGAKRAGRLPVFVCMTFQKTPRGFFTIMGNGVPDSIRVLGEAGADGVGANCTLGSSDMLLLASEFLTGTDLPALMEPNAGQPGLRNGQPVYDQSPEAFAEDIYRMVQSGVRMVGGCCGTTPEFIGAVARKLRN